MTNHDDTIAAVSSGRPPAAIAVLRISGPGAVAAAGKLARSLPAPRRAALRALRDGAGDLLDRALVIVFPGPDSVTGEDLVELHLHGGRAVTAAVERVLHATGIVRAALPGEFTRRALANGRIDLTEAEGLADLLVAETEGQRRAALALVEGAVGRELRGWMARVADVAALVEASLDHDDEGDVPATIDVASPLSDVIADMVAALDRPVVDRWRDGVHVTLAGPVNAGKSSLLNALVERNVAIVAHVAGTTRDVVEASVRREGIPFVLSDTAGQRDSDDPIERIGIDRARERVASADIVLWLGVPSEAPANAIVVHARHDEVGRSEVPAGAWPTSVPEGSGVPELWAEVARRARALLPLGDLAAYSSAQRQHVTAALGALRRVGEEDDMILVAEDLRVALASLAAPLGVDATEVMLDRVFSRFCLGK